MPPVPLVKLVITGSVKVLFVIVCTPAIVAKVPPPVGIVIVPELLILEIIGSVKVLFVNVCIPVVVAKVDEPVGIVIVPELLILEIIGSVKVLFVSVCAPDVFTILADAVVTNPTDVISPVKLPAPADTFAFIF